MPGKACAAILFLMALSAQAQTPALKTFQDAKYGVTFQYPEQWSAGPDVSFYLGSEILQQNPDGGLPDPIAKVGFVVDEDRKNFAGTNLNGVQFVYNVILNSSKDDCRKRVQSLSEDPIGAATLHGVRYNHFSGGDAGLGHQASREIFSSFQRKRCYLFEEAIHTVSMDQARPIDPAKLKHLREQLGAVMQSVRIDSAR